MTAKSYLSHAVAKPLVAGIVAGMSDHFIMKNTNKTANAYFGLAVGGGIAAVSWVEPIVSPFFPTHTPMGNIGKALEGRIIEIACGSASAYALNKYVLKNDYNNNDLMMRLGIVAGSDIVGECVCEFLLIV
jgi:hypothetical protein